MSLGRLAMPGARYTSRVDFEGEPLCICGHARAAHSDDLAKGCRACRRFVSSDPTTWRHMFDPDDDAPKSEARDEHPAQHRARARE